MNRRSLFKSMLASAVASCVRWLPMPEAPKVLEDVEGYVLSMRKLEEALELIPEPTHFFVGDIGFAKAVGLLPPDWDETVDMFGRFIRAHGNQ